MSITFEQFERAWATIETALQARRAAAHLIAQATGSECCGSDGIDDFLIDELERQLEERLGDEGPPGEDGSWFSWWRTDGADREIELDDGTVVVMSSAAAVWEFYRVQKLGPFKPDESAGEPWSATRQAVEGSDEMKRKVEGLAQAVAHGLDMARAGSERSTIFLPWPVPDELLELMARAYDREDSAQRGEPDPWRFSYDEQEAEATWIAERLACMRAAFAALTEETPR